MVNFACAVRQKSFPSPTTLCGSLNDNGEKYTTRPVAHSVPLCSQESLMSPSTKPPRIFLGVLFTLLTGSHGIHSEWHAPLPQLFHSCIDNIRTTMINSAFPQGNRASLRHGWGLIYQSVNTGLQKIFTYLILYCPPARSSNTRRIYKTRH